MSQLQYMITKLYQIDAELGGTAGAKSQKNAQDDFMLLKDKIIKILFEIRDKQKQKNSSTRSGDTIRAEIEFKNKMEEVDNIIEQMNKVLRKQAKDKKYAQKDIDQKQKVYENLRKQIKDISLTDDSTIHMTQDSSRIETLTDQKQKLMEGGNISVQRNPNKEPTEEEKEAMERWKQKDKQQDEKLDIIINGLQELNNQAVIMGEKIDESDEKIKRLDKEVDKTNKTLETTNKKLKVIIEKYRAPSKFCLDIVLVLLILGLGVTLYYYLK